MKKILGFALVAVFVLGVVAANAGTPAPTTPNTPAAVKVAPTTTPVNTMAPKANDTAKQVATQTVNAEITKKAEGVCSAKFADKNGMEYKNCVKSETENLTKATK